MNEKNNHARFFDCKTLEDCHNIGIYHLMDFLEIFGGEDVDAFVAADGSHFLVDAYSFNGDQIGLTLNKEATKLYNEGMKSHKSGEHVKSEEQLNKALNMFKG